MIIDINKVYRLLHNNHPDVVRKYIEENADSPRSSLYALDLVLQIKDMYPELGKTMSWTEAFYQYNLLLYPPPVMPSIGRRVLNFSKAIFKFVVSGLPTEEKREAKKRLSICETNECGYFDGSICRHQNCGCYTKVKTFLTTEHCPLGKW